ncbi:hypothetical protein [Algibacter sp. 2305UL17-15]|uniref:hypothetical protein n=1 Tax=Algibacter sp. 2305UL17-15 TaxID=3231268 RepID=UPI003459BFA9
MNKHQKFIFTPIVSILKEVVLANSGTNFAIETYPLSEYIMQSVFLKMTGFQEQKLKCITWEMATYDFEYRRTLLGNEDNLGECSSYKSKNKIFQRLIAVLEKEDVNFQISEFLDKTMIRNSSVEKLKDIFNGSSLLIWNQKNYNYFSSNIKEIIKPIHFANSKRNLFESSLQDLYKTLYSFRNQCAHNTLSYQHNLPTLSTLSNPKYLNHNYFIWFTQLIIIDEIFINLYNLFLKTTKDIEY